MMVIILMRAIRMVVDCDNDDDEDDDDVDGDDDDINDVIAVNILLSLSF